MILGLEAPTSGEIYLEDLRWDQLGEAERHRHRLKYQYVPQDALSALDPQQTVLEHVVETLSVLRKDSGGSSAIYATAAKTLERLGLQHRAHALPRELSGGEQRRVTLARVLCLEPKLVVADEPTSGLDPERRASVLQDLIGNLPEGAGCILVTHDLDAAAAWCHRVVVMLEGRVIEELDLRVQTPSHPYTRSLLDPWQDLQGAL
jgi:peptide/nickel transport system ATP-binding protein